MTHLPDRLSEQGQRIPGSGGLLAVLRGVSQVFLQENAASGLVILVGLATFSWRLASLALLGSAVGTATAAVLEHDGTARHGLMGYNGALVGAAASMDVGSGTHATLATGLGACACVPVQALLTRLFARRRWSRLALPALTAPFCAVAGVLHVLLASLAPPAEPLETATQTGRELGLGVFNGVAEVFLANGVSAGLLILVGLFIASWRVGLWATVGAVGAAVAGLVVDIDADTLSGGLLGYSAVLVAIAVGVTFRGDRPVWWRAAVVLVSIVATLVVRDLMLRTAVPVYTWPFVLVTWAALGLTAGRVRASGSTSP